MWVVEEDRGKQELRVYPQPVHMLAQVRGGPEVVELNEYWKGNVGQRVHYSNVQRPDSLPKKAADQKAAGNHGAGAGAGNNHEVVPT